MYTQCSHCSTLFRVTAQQIRQAAGMVRCCLCHQPFNALAALSEEPPPELTEYESTQAAKTPPPTPGIPHREVRSTVERSMAAPAPSREPVLETKAATHAGLVDVFADEPEGDVRVEAALADDSIDEAWRDEPVDPEFVLAPAEETEEESEESDLPLPLDEDVLEAVEAPGDDDLTDAVEPGLGAGSGEVEMDEPPPLRFVSPIDEEPPTPAGRGWIRFVAWGLGALVLVALLGFQYAYFMRDDLARNPTLRPWLSAMCSVAHCRLPLRRDLNQIKILRGRVLTEPGHPGVLMVRATLVNEAPFAQPYPQLRLTLMDINGNVTGRRWFAPSEYVADTVLRKQMGAGMPPKQPVAVRLELVDPGHNSENFEFDFR